MERKFTVFSNRKERVSVAEIRAAMAARGTPVEWESALLDATPEEGEAYGSGAFYPAGDRRDATKIHFLYQTAEDYFVVEDFRDEILQKLTSDAHRAALKDAPSVYGLSVRVSLLRPGASFDVSFAPTLRSLVAFLAEDGRGLIEYADGVYYLASELPRELGIG